jgi:hypothetical protein
LIWLESLLKSGLESALPWVAFSILFGLFYQPAQTIPVVYTVGFVGKNPACRTYVKLDFGDVFGNFESSMKLIADNWVWLPPSPKGLIHFLGGAFIGATPQLTYPGLLENLSNQGYGIIATPFTLTFDHQTIAETVFNTSERAFTELYRQDPSTQNLPIYGVGHSMGCKLHLLMGSLFPVQRAGNIFLAFNNYPVRRSIPLWEQIAPALPDKVEFSPTPTQTLNLAAQSYRIQRNLLVQFSTDELDQTLDLATTLRSRFGSSPQMVQQMVQTRRLPGNHLTPLSQDLQWPVGETFSPLDAVGQWLKQEMERDRYRLQQELLQWLSSLV